MKVLHINTLMTGGAALCSQRIALATKKAGVETKMLVCQGEVTDGVFKIERDQRIWNLHPILRKVKNRLKKLNIGRDEETMMYHISNLMHQSGQYEYVHVPISEYKALAEHPLVKEADIIHLHWVTGMIDYPSFFKKVRKPVVWTMHDKYPLAGLLHYVSEFHPVPECLKDIDDECKQIKRRAIGGLDNLHLVAISRLMERMSRESEVTKGLPVHLIHNGVDVNKFYRKDAKDVRRQLGIPEQNKVFLFSAYSIHDKNKGLKELILALEGMAHENITLVCVGQYDFVPETQLVIKCLGYIDNSERLSELYSMADYFVMPSFEETFAQTPLEAMACGTPVVAFPCSGAHDLINDENGVVCEAFIVDALRKGIETAMSRRYDCNAIRADVVERFSYERIGREYVKLYEAIRR